MDVITINGMSYKVSEDLPNVIDTKYISADIKDFVVKIILEYVDVRLKHNKLEETITKFYTDELNFNLSRKELDLLKEQLHYMREYLWVLERRCKHYDIDVGKIYRDIIGE